jgi:glutathione S-transferase
MERNMSLTLYGHPFSSYCQKALIALYENATPFSWRMLAPGDVAAMAELEALWPLKRFPVLVDEGKAIIEATIIIEHLGLNYPGPIQFIPSNPQAALEVRFMDRFFDNYIMTPMMRIVFDHLRTPENRDPQAKAEARSALDTAYRWLDARMGGRSWASGDTFSLADCAAAPALFYADWTHPIGKEHERLRAYRSRLIERPSFARAVDEARPYRSLFPLGAPDRD